MDFWKLHMTTLRSTFEVVLQTDTHVIILDLDNGSSVTNDACSVIVWLEANLLGGIGQRRVYYRDTMGRFDELCVLNGTFNGFRSCSQTQQVTLISLLMLSGSYA